ncbi:acyltransferase [Pedobacter nototheniae]|uniref:acyltransferase family protein n=1 Tax=Pedobacter nototheniae TaxID=2488994 RepID=UPI00292ED0FB|nr:acyltransferase [Pedobacter nototheniae]
MQLIKKSQLNIGVQQLRGLAALAVVLCHYGSDLNNYHLLSKIFNKGQIGVHVFFLISGYIILHALIKNNYHPKNFFRFLLKRVIRIDPPYIIVIILTLVTFWLLGFIPSYNGNIIPFIPGQFISHLFYIIPFTKWGFYNTVFWTLCVEFQFYILIGLLYFISNSAIYKITFLLLFALSTFANFQNSYYLVTNYAPIFALGMAQMQYTKTKQSTYLIVMLVCLFIVYYKFDVLITLTLIAAGLIIQYCNRSFKPLVFLGKISYSLYLIHPLILIYLLGIGKKLFDIKKHELLFLFSELTIVIIAAYVFYILIENKTRNLAKKLKYSSNGSS